MTLYVLASLALISCGGNKKVPSANPNHMLTMQAYSNNALAKAKMVESLAQGCAKSSPEQAGWCTALIATQVLNSGGGKQDRVPSYVKKPTKGDILLSKGLNILGSALPFAANVIISKDSNKANVAVQESRNAMMNDIITSGFDSMTTLGSQPTTSVGGDYITGDNNGDGDRYGDGNVVGDGNVMGDGNGDGDRFGDGDNIVGDGDNIVGDGDNVVGDNNGDGNIFDNTIGDGLFTGDGNGDDNSDNSNDPDPDDP